VAIPQICIRAIRESDLHFFKALRLEALQAHPEAFGTDYSDQVKDSDEVWQGRIRAAVEGITNGVFVAEAGGELAGMAGVFRDNGIKVKHSANIWGVYVRPAWRGKKIAGRMVEEILAWCVAREVQIVRLAVVTGNASAIRCYQQCGFEGYGIAPEVIRVGERYYDELMMWRRVGSR
jgi:RimJ/RimL family protein N-acetyltransferase